MWTDIDGDGVGDLFNYMLPRAVNTGTPANPRHGAPRWSSPRTGWRPHPDPARSSGSARSPRARRRWQADGGLDWSPSSPGEMFDRAQRGGATDAWPTSGSTTLDAVFWMQGEQDATRPTGRPATPTTCGEFLAAVRADWMHDPHGYVGLGRITDSAALPYNADVRYAEWLVDQEDPDLESFKTIGFEMQPDGIHYDAAGTWRSATASSTTGWPSPLA
jgi:hypothetical protein